MYGCESWTVKKAEHWRISAFELWCWRRLLRVPWTARRSNQSVLKKMSPGCSLEGLMLKLKLQYFDDFMRRVDSLEKTLMLGGIGGRRRRGRQRMRGWMASPTRCTWVWVNSRSWWWTGRPGVLRFMGSQRVGYDWATELNCCEFYTCEKELLILENVIAFIYTFVLTQHIYSFHEQLLTTLLGTENTRWRNSLFSGLTSRCVFKSFLCSMDSSLCIICLSCSGHIPFSYQSTWNIASRLNF